MCKGTSNTENLGVHWKYCITRVINFPGSVVNRPFLSLPLTGPAVRYSKFKMSEAKAPPLLGQHTKHILKEVLRYDDRSIGELLSSGVIQQHEI